MAVRIATDKYSDGMSCIEMDETGVMWLKSKDASGSMSLPCCIEDVKTFFLNIGREFDPAKLPKGAKRYPY